MPSPPAKRIRIGLKRCGHCKLQFTVKVGTVFEHARMPLNKMLQAIYLMTGSKKGISAHQLHRFSEVTYKTADKFKEAARELECDEDEARCDERLRKVAKQKPPEKERE
jgi:transposase-like protein